MHIKPMAESDGKFKTYDDGKQEHQSMFDCPKCRKSKMRYKVWESNCGGYEDVKLRCPACKYTYWVDGPDS